MAKRETLPPGELPDIHDTDPPPLHPATVIGDGVVYVDEEKLHPKRHNHEPEPDRRHPQQEPVRGRQEAPQRR
jgi:hypothetical protein